MKLALLSAAVALALSPTIGSGPAQAKGCIKGALAGGVAGHLVHHGVLGAIGGCVVGHHMASEKDKQQQGATAQNPHPGQQPNGD